MYNSVDQEDIRLEINFPGKIETYSVSKASPKEKIEDSDWFKAHVISVLRSFNPVHNIGTRILPELLNRIQFKYFIQYCLLMIKDSDIINEKNHDLIKATPHPFVEEVLNYLLRKHRYDDCREFIEACILYIL